jgi:hypothetical protein
MHVYFSSHDRHQGAFNVGRRTHKLSYMQVLDKATEH